MAWCQRRAPHLKTWTGPWICWPDLGMRSLRLVSLCFQTQTFPLRTSTRGLWFRALTHQANSQECLCGRLLPVVLHWVWPYQVLIGPRQQQFSWFRTDWIDWLFSLIALWFHPFSAFSSYFLPLPFFFFSSTSRRSLAENTSKANAAFFPTFYRTQCCILSICHPIPKTFLLKVALMSINVFKCSI